jgi:hypothetical protein
MLAAIDWATRYRKLAEGCLKLSELASDDDLRAHFRKVAANYLAMARAEVTRAEQECARDQPQE